MRKIQTQILQIVADYDACSELYWDSSLKFYVICNDIFGWACADAEEIVTQEDVDLLHQSIKDSEYNGMVLYCARKRNIMPIGAWMESYCEEDVELFKTCGVER